MKLTKVAVITFLLLSAFSFAQTKGGSEKKEVIAAMPTEGIESLQSKLDLSVKENKFFTEEDFFVQILVSIGSEGNVKECKIVRSTFKEFDPALETLLFTKIIQAEWSAGTRNGINVDSFRMIPFQFHVD